MEKQKNIRPAAWPLLILLTLFSSPASASTMVYLELPALVELSDVVLEGRVIDQKTFMEDGSTLPVTITTIRVKQAFKGDVGAEVKVRQRGGFHSGANHTISGDASFEAYEHVILFLKNDRNRTSKLKYLTALSQAKLSVRDSDGGLRVDQSFGHLGFINASGKYEHVEPSSRDYSATIKTIQYAIEVGGK